MNTALTVQTSGGISIADGKRSVEQLVAQREAIVEAMQKVMRKDIDFGTVPGTKKPSLWKPGSEKILSMFNLACDPTVEDLSTPDTIRYRVTASIRHIPSGSIMGAGVGEASSAESKYQWRRAVCPEEYEDTPDDRRRIKWQKAYGGGFEEIEQVRTEMEDVANTVLKMAKKRSQIDAVLTVTAASDIFAQDIEDLVAAGLGPDPDPSEDGDSQPATQATHSRPQDLQRKAAPAANAQPARSAGVAVISEKQANMWWARAMGTHMNKQALISFLTSRLGVDDSKAIPQSRWQEALDWAEGKGR